MWLNLLIISTLIAMALIVYHHLGYPLALKWLTRHKPMQTNFDEKAYSIANSCTATLPSITIVMPAYNEACWIAEKIRNIAMLDYPSDKLTVLIACDGCTDDTAAIARQTASEPLCQTLKVTVLEFTDNRGKVATLNDAAMQVTTDIIAFSDVSALISFDALQLAAERFRRHSVGVVNSQYGFIHSSTEEKNYWQYQNQIQHREAQLGSALGAHGALYFIRRELFSPLRADTINDDFVLPMEIVGRGYRAEAVAQIHAIELEQTTGQQDFRRRLRIGAGNCQQLLRLMHLLHPRYRGVAFAFASGKALRVLMPFLMLWAFIGSLILSTTAWIFALAAVGQFALYGLVLYWHLRRSTLTHKACKALDYLVVGHTANLIGCLRYLFGLENGHWQRVGQERKS
ncbi:glycosyltransferase family 2 protein [Vibrio sp. SM6]|uniref:Glycosyltransferase family 2 protein n=1 Tax=Vibrio agarilyticus TaxID=2726741 RepID=A0A7X8YGV5_9VIBR|nr:glycosyltransferase family 2 protein [Vibrio agarilyticus]NLS12925.1 glycosyltransferase family 2 protein [Vibrio agarilyticus]